MKLHCDIVVHFLCFRMNLKYSLLAKALFEKIYDSKKCSFEKPGEKAGLQQWLERKSVKFPADTLRNKLCKWVKRVRVDDSQCVRDSLAKASGHDVIRLPPYHSEYKPIELNWELMKGYVARNNTTYRLDDVLRLMNEFVNCIDNEKGQSCCRHVITYQHKARSLGEG